MSITYFTGGYAQAPVQTLTTPKGQSFAYRALGAPGSVPIVALVHLAANLDNWDPQLLDLLAAGRPIIAVDYAGVGKSTGTAGTTVKNMAEGIIEFLDAAGLETVDLLGLSLGGFVVQQLLLDAPHRFRKAILAGTGPAGGVGITRVPLLTFQAMLRSFIKRRDPKYYLFFPESAWDKADKFFDRISGFAHPDTPIRVPSFLRQLRAVYAWGKQSPQDLSNIKHPVLVVNGEHDVMVPSANTINLATRIPNAVEVDLYPGAGHGAIFQEPVIFAEQVQNFL